MSQETTNHSFDDLARGLASGSISRGRALKLMGAALVGGTLASFGIGGVAVADDECKRTGKKCRKNAQCCSGNCSGGTCAACASGQVECNGSCVSTSCPTGQTFNTTTCQCECPSGQVLCNGSCVSTSCSEGQIFDPSSCACVAQCIPASSPTTTCSQCCSGTCQPGSLVCCTGLGGTCTASVQCCGGARCDTDGTCCSDEACTTNSDCCSSRPFCVDLGSPLGRRCSPL